MTAPPSFADRWRRLRLYHRNFRLAFAAFLGAVPLSVALGWGLGPESGFPFQLVLQGVPAITGVYFGVLRALFRCPACGNLYVGFLRLTLPLSCHHCGLPLWATESSKGEGHIHDRGEKSDERN